MKSNQTPLAKLRQENQELKAKVAELEASVQAFLEEQEQLKEMIALQNRSLQPSTRGIASRIVNESRAALQRSRDAAAARQQ